MTKHIRKFYIKSIIYSDSDQRIAETKDCENCSCKIPKNEDNLCTNCIRNGIEEYGQDNNGCF